MAKDQKTTAPVTENTVEAKIAELNSTSRGLALAKEKIQKNEDQAAAEDAMAVLGISNYVNLKTLAYVRRKRKEADLMKSFLMKTKSLLEIATREEGDKKEHDQAFYDELAAKFKDKDMTKRDYREEFAKINTTLKDDLYKVRNECDNAVSDLRRVLENHGVWNFNFQLEY